MSIPDSLIARWDPPEIYLCLQWSSGRQPICSDIARPELTLASKFLSKDPRLRSDIVASHIWPIVLLNRVWLWASVAAGLQGQVVAHTLVVILVACGNVARHICRDHWHTLVLLTANRRQTLLQTVGIYSAYDWNRLRYDSLAGSLQSLLLRDKSLFEGSLVCHFSCTAELVFIKSLLTDFDNSQHCPNTSTTACFGDWVLSLTDPRSVLERLWLDDSVVLDKGLSAASTLFMVLIRYEFRIRGKNS